MNILEAIDNNAIFGKQVKHKSYGAWRAFLAAMFGLPMTEAELVIFQECTGRTTAPTEPFREAMLPTGRRAGKSFTLALVAVYLANFTDYRPYLGPGERGTVMIMASDRKQARTIFNYCRGLILGSPTLRRRLEGETREQLILQNNVTIEVVTASHKTTRGYTVVAALLDELAFYGTEEEAASSDIEILNALRPGMGLIPNSMLLGASSPYARRGVLWNSFDRYYGKDDAPIMVWKAGTRTMNPTFPQSIIDRAMEEDASAAGAEYLAEFRGDIENFVTIEAIQDVTDKGVKVRDYVGQRHVAAVDPAGGGSGTGDSMCLAISHQENGVAILDKLIEKKPPFSTESVVQEFADVLKEYGLDRVTGDRWGGQFCQSAFRRYGIRYDPTERARSDIYLECLPLISSGRVKLLDNPTMAFQFVNLERKTGKNGKDIVNHRDGKNWHDDLCNVAALALNLAAFEKPRMSPAQMLAYNRMLMGRMQR